MWDADLPSPCDVIVVLGAAVWPGGQPSPALHRRVRHAVHLFHAGRGRMLLMTGGRGLHSPAEAHLMRELAMAAGVPAERIVVEDQATSTWQSALLCMPILQQHGWSTVLVVTDRYHLIRALLVFRSLGVWASGSAPPDGQYSKRLWKRWCYRGREALALCWYIVLLVTLRMRRKRHLPSRLLCLL